MKSLNDLKKPASSSRNTATAATLGQRFLITLIGLLIAVLLTGTIYGLVFKDPSAPPLYRFGGKETAPLPADATPRPAMEQIFTGIGLIRTVTAGTRPATVVLSVDFPYRPDDLAFTEELVNKVPLIRNTTREYLESFSADKLRIQGEALIKSDLLNRYNTLLQLGQIEVLYFSDFMIIE
jgi:flagellar basal body-associated protein FliL